MTVAAVMLDRLLHRAAVVGIDGPSYRLRSHQSHAESMTPSSPDPAPLAPTAIRNCPYCDKPVTIVALLAHT
ncbi:MULTISPECIES: ATP-binding protein [unclassified Streptomyces]|uniref:ATP-binding protein n=1 Tax=unclassified Streptomyces TaxID=2593676 RepID=UPI002E29B460|nr:ATP-binding protein [Streptomyces sp. NBC_01439]